MENEPVEINIVTAEELMALRGVGQVYADRIIAYRDEHGPYRSAEDLANVKGISPQLVQQFARDIDWRAKYKPEDNRITGGELAKDVLDVFWETEGALRAPEQIGEEIRRPRVRPEPIPRTPASDTEEQEPVVTPEPEHTEVEPEPIQTPQVRRYSPIEPEVVRVPAGPFLMGSRKSLDAQADEDELPQFRCRLIHQDFYIGRYTITVAEYQRFIDTGGYRNSAWWTRTGWEWRERCGRTGPFTWANEHCQRANHPRVGVSWFEAVAYCRWLSAALGRLYRLPTEAEWEKAARGTDGRLYPWGNASPTSALCNFKRNVGATTPVGSYSPRGDSPYGCADMAGNVWEWCSSEWLNNYERYEQQIDDDLEGHTRRVVRGGSWWANAHGARSPSRHYWYPGKQLHYGSFRVVVLPRNSW